jgi:hypothetical protein
LRAKRCGSLQGLVCDLVALMDGGRGDVCSASMQTVMLLRRENPNTCFRRVLPRDIAARDASRGAIRDQPITTAGAVAYHFHPSPKVPTTPPISTAETSYVWIYFENL